MARAQAKSKAPYGRDAAGKPLSAPIPTMPELYNRLADEEGFLALTLDKDCKHSTRYSMDADEQTFSIYVPKSLLPTPRPPRIAVQILPLRK